MQLLSGLVVALHATCALAAPSPFRRAAPVIRDGQPAGHSGAESCRGPGDRGCWSDGWGIDTDFETNVPYTGVTRRYTFDVEEFDDWVGGDGQVKAKAMLINGGYPGPTVRADWGDTIEVTVNNKLRINGTSLHWHGIRMLNNNVNDGANGVTECPLAPGKSKKYTFLAEQYGTTWYHSHFGSQYANGAVGAVVIDGPASADYDTDLGVLQITDWYYGAADAIQSSLNNVLQASPDSDNVLFNGRAVGPNATGGEYLRFSLEPAKKHRLRLVNPSVDNTFSVSLVNHKFTVISQDMVPVRPSEPLDTLFLAVGQRYDVIVEADQPADNYWFNVTLDSSGLCGVTNAIKPAMIFGYEGAAGAGADAEALPTNPGPKIPDSGCVDNLVFSPIVHRECLADDFDIAEGHDIDVMLATGTKTVKWDVRGHDINVTWGDPTLQYVAKGVTDFPDNLNIIHNDEDQDWSYWLVQNVGLLPHPMHLHGHDFLVLGRSDPVPNPFNVTSALFRSKYAFNKERDLARLNFVNPSRRDVTMLPGWGWLVLAFRTDNPGAWLMHCHIGWHVSQGLGVQFLERVSAIPTTLSLNSIQDNCNDWTTYWSDAKLTQYDSGL